MWTPSEYAEALQAVREETDPKARAELQAAIREYQALNPQAAQPTGIEAFEAATGMQQPSDDEAFKAVDKAAKPPTTEKNKRPGRVGRGSPSSWYEPSLEQFKRDMRPVIGLRADETEDGGEVTESDPLYQAYADRKWAEASDAAQKSGKSLERISQRESKGWVDTVKNLPSEVLPYLQSAALGAEETGAVGLGTELGGRFLESTGIEPTARADYEQAREWSPIARGVGNVAGYLNPFAPAMMAGKAVAKLVGPKLGLAAAKAGGGFVPRAAAKGLTGAAAGATGLAAEGAAQELAKGEVPGSDEAPADPEAFIRRRLAEAQTGALGGVAAETVGAGARALGRSQAARAAAKDSELLEALSTVAALGSGGPGAVFSLRALLGATKKGGPTMQKLADKLEALPRQSTKLGANPFAPFMGGRPGGIIATPLTGAPSGESSLTEDEAQQLLQQLLDEPAQEKPVEAEPISPPAGYKFKEEPTGALNPFTGTYVPAGFAGDLAESVSSLFGGEKQAPIADYKSDPEFMAMLKKLDAVKDPEERADTRAGYIRNYATWRKQADEAKAEGDLNPDLSLKLTGRFNTKGYLKPGDKPVAANAQVGAEYDTEETERGAGIPPDKQAQAHQEIEKALGPNYTAQDIVKAVAQRVQVGATVPKADRVFDAIKALGFRVSMPEVKQILRSYQELEI